MTASSRRWAYRIGTAFVFWAAVVAAGNILGNHPQPVLLGLGVGAFGSVLWLYLDASVEHEAPDWERTADDRVREPGEDPRLSFLTRVIAQHLDGREVDGNLREHLLDLADHRLVARHGLAWRTDPVRAEPLLGPELTSLAQQRPPFTRLTLDQIDVLLRRIENL